MKHVLMVLTVFLISTVGAYAQGRGGDMQARMKERVENYVKELKLEGEKADKFKELQNSSMEKIRKEMEAMRESGSSDREAVRGKMQKINEERDAEIKKILTDDEFKKYQELLSKEPQRPGGGRNR